MQRSQRSFVLSEHAVHLVMSEVRCHIGNALQQDIWCRSSHIACTSRLQGCMRATSHWQHTHEDRVGNKQHHRAACTVAATHTCKQQQSVPIERSHIPCRRLLNAAPSHQQRFVPGSTSFSTVAHWMGWLYHSHHHCPPSRGTSDAPLAYMRSVHAGTVQEEEPEVDDNTTQPAPSAQQYQYHEELTFDAEGFAVAHALTPLAVAERQRKAEVDLQAALATAADPVARTEALQDSLSGMLCVLQLLPDDTSDWIATYLGFHSVAAMVALRGDLAGAHVAQVCINAAKYCKADSAAAAQLSGSAASGGVVHAQLQELLLDDGLPTLLRLTDGSEIELPKALQCVYVLANLSRLNQLLRTRPGLVAPDGVLLSMIDGRGGGDSMGRLEAGQNLLKSPESHAEKLRGFRELFSALRRLGVSRTLHRVACIEGLDGAISGLTIRIGRHVPAAAWPLTDVLAMLYREHSRSKYGTEPFDIQGGANPRPAGLPCSVLLLGGPASGKTTILRDISKQLSVRLGLGRRVVIVDSSSEIGGQAQVHPACFLSRD